MQQTLSIIWHRKRVHVPLNEQVFRWALCVCIYMYDGVSVCSCILSLRCVFTPAHVLDHRNHSISLQRDHFLPPVIPGISFVSVCVWDDMSVMLEAVSVCSCSPHSVGVHTVWQWKLSKVLTPKNNTLYGSALVFLILFYTLYMNVTYNVWGCSF